MRPELALSYRNQRRELSHAGPVMSTANAELKRPTGVGSSDFLDVTDSNTKSFISLTKPTCWPTS
jgi:hypothetical protein